MKKAFTLTELLIAMTIIGVVLVIVVPIVVTKMTAKAQKSALQAHFATMNNAVKMLMVNERAGAVKKTSLYRTSDTDSLSDTAGEFLKTYFKIVEDCETSPDTCFAEKYKNISGDEISFFDAGYCVSLSTGPAVCLMPNTGNKPAIVVVDVNGPAKPNIAGIDLFRYYIYNNGYVGEFASGNVLDNIMKNSRFWDDDNTDNDELDDDPTIDDTVSGSSYKNSKLESGS